MAHNKIPKGKNHRLINNASSSIPFVHCVRCGKQVPFNDSYCFKSRTHGFDPGEPFCQDCRRQIWVTNMLEVLFNIQYILLLSTLVFNSLKQEVNDDE